MRKWGEEILIPIYTSDTLLRRQRIEEMCDHYALWGGEQKDVFGFEERILFRQAVQWNLTCLGASIIDFGVPMEFRLSLESEENRRCGGNSRPLSPTPAVRSVKLCLLTFFVSVLRHGMQIHQRERRINAETNELVVHAANFTNLSRYRPGRLTFSAIVFFVVYSCSKQVKAPDHKQSSLNFCTEPILL